MSYLSGCSSKCPDSTVPGVYSLKITATGAQTGLTHTINLPLTVTQSHDDSDTALQRRK